MVKEIRTLRLGYTKNARPLYESLVSQSSERVEEQPFKTQKDLFMMAACLGAHFGTYAPTITHHEIPGSVLDETEDVPVLLALAYKASNQDLSVLSDAKRVVQLAEGWAEVGIQHLQAILEEKGRAGTKLEKLAEAVLAATGKTVGRSEG